MVRAAARARRDVIADQVRDARAAPLIITAELPGDLQALADRLRTAHYPKERNVLRAHCTLFHALPPSALDEARACLSRVARENPPPRARLTGVMSLGRGTALALECRDLLAIRDAVAEHFHGLLTSQDQHRPRLHVTVQNKVTPGAAKLLLAELAQAIDPRDFTFRGLALHQYLGGPWASAGSWAFRG